MNLRILLFGGTDLSLTVAERLVAIGLPPAAVVHVGESFPISYSPEGVRNVRFADLKSWAEGHDIPNLAYQDAKRTAEFAESVGVNFGLVAGWYHMVPGPLRDRFRLGCAGLHASLLPRFRGGAPLSWALLAGETRTGVSLFELEDEVDAGPLYGQRSFAIGPRSRIGDLVAAAETASLALIEECLPAIAEGRLVSTPQTGTPSYCLQRVPDDGWIDWSWSAEKIDRLIRAVGRPYAGAVTSLHSTKVFVWSAEPIQDVLVYGMPGQITRLPGDSDPCVVTGEGVLAIRDATGAEGRSVLVELCKASQQRFDGTGPAAGAWLR